MALSEYHNETTYQPDHLWKSFEAQARKSGQLPAVIKLKTADQDQNFTLTYTQLEDAATHMAAELYRQGVREGDAICMMLPNCIEFLIMLWASFRVGAILAPISPAMSCTTNELEHMLKIAEPKVVIVEDYEMADALNRLRSGDIDLNDFQKARPLRGSREGFGILSSSHGNPRYQAYPPWPSLQARLEDSQVHSLHLPVLEDFSPNNDALLMFTSGSTSLPKGCLHTHFSYSAGCHGFATLRHMQPGKSRLVAHRPLFHAFSLSYAIAITLSGGAIVLPTSKDYDPATSIHAIKTAKCTHMAAIPSMMHSLAAHSTLPENGLSSLESIDLGGDLVTPAIIDMCKQKLKARYISASHGMTETVGLLGHDNHDLDKYTTAEDAVAVSVGRPVPGMTARICDPETRNVTNRGQEGELHVSGLVLFSRYLGGTGETTYQDDQSCRWLITGDQAVMAEDGNITVIGRYKDIIVRDANKLSPTRIGTAIEQLDSIDKAVVVAVEDEVSGQLPVAVVSAAETGGQDLAEQVQRHVEKTLGKSSVPDQVLSLFEDLEMEAWPQTSAGKLNKKVVQQAVRDHLR